ncbi:MAG: tail fiber domain-containing protein [Flavobacterium sp.]|nr:tail fiber domain-containing protein [Flavobacterium sp.]
MASFEAGIYGQTRNSNGNQWDSFFEGDVFIGGTYQGSDAKLKDNVKPESSILAKLLLLKPVTYNYKEISEMNLTKGNQHGFISQELATVFPELTRDISKPVFDKEGKVVSKFDFKAVNYNGLISVLTAGINELNNELKSLKQELSEIKATTKTNDANNQGFFMEQNIPNPFADQTVFRYQLPNGTTTAEIAVFDMTGKPIKSFVVTNSQKEITIKSTEIRTGLFIYSLVQNGQELITERMIVK